MRVVRSLGRLVVGSCILAGVSGGCSSGDAASRAEEVEKRIRSQLIDPQAVALAQKTTPEAVKEAQEHLQTLREYLGDANGVLDAVTVNAIMAFQTSAGLESDGILTERTMKRLRAAAAEKQAKAK